MSSATPAEVIGTYDLEEDTFIPLLTKLIAETQYLQDSPPDFIPQETRAANHVLDVLRPYTVENGGPLVVELVEYTEGRGNLLITYPGNGKSDKCVSFVGSHLDVVPADPAQWERPPFELIIEGDKLYGRGTTDCLGHVAAITCLFAKLGQTKPDLDIAVHAVFIASEEAEDKPGVGVDGLMAAGKLDKLKNGPVYWVDSADSQPCIGTAGAITWHLTAYGKLFHSGFPHKTVNAIELAFEAVKAIQAKFYAEYPAHPSEAVYKFGGPSSLKATRVAMPKGGLNQIPGECTISGDVRLTPFYPMPAVMDSLRRFAEEINADVTALPTHGPHQKFEVPEVGVKGRIEFKIEGTPMPGVACDLESPGFKALCAGIEAASGKPVTPFSVGGSLPLVDILKTNGFDLQIVGFGLMSTYHANNEYCLLSGMRIGFKSLAHVIASLNASA